MAKISFGQNAGLSKAEQRAQLEQAENAAVETLSNVLQPKSRYGDELLSFDESVVKTLKNLEIATRNLEENDEWNGRPVKDGDHMKRYEQILKKTLETVQALSNAISDFSPTGASTPGWTLYEIEDRDNQKILGQSNVNMLELADQLKAGIQDCMASMHRKLGQSNNMKLPVSADHVSKYGEAHLNTVTDVLTSDHKIRPFQKLARPTISFDLMT